MKKDEIKNRLMGLAADKRANENVQQEKRSILRGATKRSPTQEKGFSFQYEENEYKEIAKMAYVLRIDLGLTNKQVFKLAIQELYDKVQAEQKYGE